MTTAKMNNICVSVSSMDKFQTFRVKVELWLADVGGKIIPGQKWPLIVQIPKRTDKSWLRNILSRYGLSIQKSINSAHSLSYYNGSSGCCASCDYDNWAFGPKKVVYYI